MDPYYLDPSFMITPGADYGYGTGGLSEGYGHIQIPMEVMLEQQALEMLRPQRYQQATQFAGGSHYGPSRDAFVPPEMAAQANATLTMLQGRRMGEIDEEKARLDLDKKKRAEEIMALYMPQQIPGQPPGFTSGRRLEEMTPYEQLALAAAGYLPGGAPGAGGRGGKGGGQTDDVEFKDVSDRIATLEERYDAAATAGDKARMDAIEAQLKPLYDYMNRKLSGGPREQAPPLTTPRGLSPAEVEASKERSGYRGRAAGDTPPGQRGMPPMADVANMTEDELQAALAGMSWGERPVQRTSGQEFFEKETAGQGPFRDTLSQERKFRQGQEAVGETIKQAFHGPVSGGRWDQEQDRQRLALGYDPQTGERMTSNHPYFQNLDPGIQQQILNEELSRYAYNFGG